MFYVENTKFIFASSLGSQADEKHAYPQARAHGPQPGSGVPTRGLRLPDKWRRPRGRPSGNLLSHSSGGQTSAIKVSKGLVPPGGSEGESSLPRDLRPSPLPCVCVSSLVRTPAIGFGPTLT